MAAQPVCLPRPVLFPPVTSVSRPSQANSFSPVIVVPGKRLQLVENLGVVIHRLQIVNHGSRPRWCRCSVPIGDAEVGSAAKQQNHGQRHGSQRTNMHRWAVSKAGAQPGEPAIGRGLPLFPHSCVQPRKEIRARLRSLPGIQQRHGSPQLGQLPAATVASVNMRSNLGRHGGWVQQQVCQLRFHRGAIVFYLFHDYHPTSRRFRPAVFPYTKSFNLSRSV